MKNNRLAVVWSSGDLEVAEKVCLMYTKNAKINNWFDDVVLIIWGPSARLLAENESLQKQVNDMSMLGVRIEACISCADMYGVTEQLGLMDIDVKPMGIPLTNYLKEDWHCLTF